MHKAVASEKGKTYRAISRASFRRGVYNNVVSLLCMPYPVGLDLETLKCSDQQLGREVNCDIAILQGECEQTSARSPYSQYFKLKSCRWAAGPCAVGNNARWWHRRR